MIQNLNIPVLGPEEPGIIEFGTMEVAHEKDTDK
jgi:hypothetical protein